MKKKLSILSQRGIVATLCCVIIALFSSCGKQLEDVKINKKNSDITGVEVCLPGYTSEESEYISRLLLNWHETEKEMSNLAFLLYNMKLSSDDWKQQTSDEILLLNRLFDEQNHFVVPSSCTKIQKVYTKGIDEYQRQISSIASAMESLDKVTIDKILDELSKDNEYLEALPMIMEEVKKVD